MGVLLAPRPMGRRLAFKSYPLLKPAIVVSILLVAVGLYVSGVFNTETDTDQATRVLLPFLIGAVAIPFLSLLKVRRVSIEVPAGPDTSKLSASQRAGVLRELKAARDRGELTEERYERARKRLETP